MQLPLALPQLVDGVIAITLVECAVLLAFDRFGGIGVKTGDFLLNLLAGLCLMLALRSVVRDQAALWTAACLLAAGVAHALDLRRRWRRKAVPGAATELHAD